MTSLFSKIKDVAQMRKQAKTLQAALAQETVVGSSANGFFTITLDGNQNVLKVDIKEQIVGDKVQLERCAKEALSRAFDNLKKLMVSKYSNLLK